MYNVEVTKIPSLKPDARSSKLTTQTGARL